MGYTVRRSAHGGDRRHGRSLAETLEAGNDRYGEEGWTGRTFDAVGEDDKYDEAYGPTPRNPRPFQEEWGPRASGVRYPTGIHWEDSDEAEVPSRENGKKKTASEIELNQEALDYLTNLSGSMKKWEK